MMESRDNIVQPLPLSMSDKQKNRKSHPLKGTPRHTSPMKFFLAKKSRRNHPMDEVDKLLSTFGFQLTKDQLTQLEQVIGFEGATPRGSNNSSTPKSPSRLWKFKRLEKKSRKKIDISAQQTVNLRQIEICQQIGCGASSAGVYMCIVDGWSCAMKQLKRELVGQLDIKCFEREMDILYRLPPHPNIVRYLFHTALGSDLCLFMQLYSGTLRDFLDERKNSYTLLEAELIAEMALEIASGIQFLHQHGVIHRDIKSGNIFVTRNEAGEVTNLAVGDFDTSKRVQTSNFNLKSMNISQHPVSSSHLLANLKDKRRSPAATKRDNFAKMRPVSTVGK